MSWVLSTLQKAGVNLNMIGFVFLPAGTGNDLSTSTGHFGTLPTEKFAKSYSKGMLELISLYLNPEKSETSKFDIWDVELQVADEGAIKQVKREIPDKSNPARVVVSKQPILDENGKKKVFLKTLMNNYCSVGIGARIGIGFDKKRSESRACNKMVYCCEGLKKVFCTGGGGKIKTIVDKMEYVVDLQHQNPANNGQNLNTSAMGLYEKIETNRELMMTEYNKIHIGEDSRLESIDSFHQRDVGGFKITTKTVFRSDPKTEALDSKTTAGGVNPGSMPATTAQKGGMTQPSNINIKNQEGEKKVIQINPVTLIACNINSYGGSSMFDMWDKAKTQAPIIKRWIDGKPQSKQIEYFQHPGDGKIEFLGFTSGVSFGICEKLCPGQGNRIAQGTKSFSRGFRGSAFVFNTIFNFFI